MLDINLHTIKSHLTNDLVKMVPSYPITKKSHFRLIEGVSVTLTNQDVIDIPKGFEFDGSSSPRFLWWIFPSYGDFFFAALVHDYLYSIRYMADKIGNKRSQEFADKEMLRWSCVINNKNIWKMLDNYLRFYAVRLFGKKKFIT